MLQVVSDSWPLPRTSGHQTASQPLAMDLRCLAASLVFFQSWPDSPCAAMTRLYLLLHQLVSGIDVFTSVRSILLGYGET